MSGRMIVIVRTIRKDQKDWRAGRQKERLPVAVRGVMGNLRFPLIVIPALGNKYGVIMKGIYHAVLQINSPRPESGQLMFKRFRFTNSNKRIPLYIFD